MTLVHTECADSIVYCLFIGPEHIPVKGNALASGDDKEDKRAERWIQRQLDKGNQWAWCVAKCEARHSAHPDISGEDYLGTCSYRNTKDFIQPGGYWDDMKHEALNDLNRRLAQ